MLYADPEFNHQYACLSCSMCVCTLAICAWVRLVHAPILIHGFFFNIYLCTYMIWLNRFTCHRKHRWRDFAVYTWWNTAESFRGVGSRPDTYSLLTLIQIDWVVFLFWSLIMYKQQMKMAPITMAWLWILGESIFFLCYFLFQRELSRNIKK